MSCHIRRQPHSWRPISKHPVPTLPACRWPNSADTAWQVTEEEEEEEIHGSRRSMVPGSRRSLDTSKRASSRALDLVDDEKAAMPRKTWRQRLPWYRPTEEEKRMKAEQKAQQVCLDCICQPPHIVHWL